MNTMRKGFGLLNMFSLARLVPGRRCRKYLSEFEEDPDLARDVHFWFTVKHKKQVALNRIVRQRLTHGKSMKVLGGKTHRPYRNGILVCGDSSGGLHELPLEEPFGIDHFEGKVAIATANKVRLYDVINRTLTVFQYEWFAQNHSVSFSKDGSRLLVASTGYDSVVEFAIDTAAITWFWCSWDRGYDTSPTGIRLRRSENAVHIYRNGAAANAPERMPLNAFGLPTGYSATHLNNAQYHDNEMMLMTLFHQGRAILVDRQSGEVSEVLRGLLNPHGFEPAWNEEKIVTDTRRGRVIFFDHNFLVKRTLIFDRDEPVAERLDLGEWLQNVLPLTSGLYGAIDMHRSCIWVVDMDGERFRRINVPPQWAVQNIISMSPTYIEHFPNSLADFSVTTKQLVDCNGLTSVEPREESPH